MIRILADFFIIAQKPQRSRKERLPAAPNSHFVSSPITAIIKSA